MMPTAIQKRESGGECRRCESFKGGCAIHERRMRKELAAKYFKAGSYSRHHPRPNMYSFSDQFELLEGLLGDKMELFCKNYGTLRCDDDEQDEYKRVELAVAGETMVEHGKLNVAFRADSICQDDRYCILAPRNGRPSYFAMGAVFTMGAHASDFGCLFEDGKYYISYHAASSSGPKKRGSAARLRRLEELIFENLAPADTARPEQ